MELVAQGTANIFSALFGGIPATGAIARTATNVKNGGRTPVAGIIHALVLLLILLFVGKWASYIPLANLAGILVVVAYNMSEWQNFRSILKGPKGDVAVMVITFLLTVLIDLTVAIQIGMVLAVFLFMRKMILTSNVSVFAADIEDNEFGFDLVDGKFQLPKDVEVFEIIGPLFFGSAFKFKEAMRYLKKHPKILIIRMRHVPMIDATGIQTLKDVCEQASRDQTKIILSEIESRQVNLELEKARLLFAIGKANITNTFGEAITRTNDILADKFYSKLSH